MATSGLTNLSQIPARPQVRSGSSEAVGATPAMPGGPGSRLGQVRHGMLDECGSRRTSGRRARVSDDRRVARCHCGFLSQTPTVACIDGEGAADRVVAGDVGRLRESSTTSPRGPVAVGDEGPERHSSLLVGEAVSRSSLKAPGLPGGRVNPLREDCTDRFTAVMSRNPRFSGDELSSRSRRGSPRGRVSLDESSHRHRCTAGRLPVDR